MFVSIDIQPCSPGLYSAAPFRLGDSLICTHVTLRYLCLLLVALVINCYLYKSKLNRINVRLSEVVQRHTNQKKRNTKKRSSNEESTSSSNHFSVWCCKYFINAIYRVYSIHFHWLLLWLSLLPVCRLVCFGFCLWFLSFNSFFTWRCLSGAKWE